MRICKQLVRLCMCVHTQAAKRGLLLVDTKYEFGKDENGVIRLIDEVRMGWQGCFGANEGSVQCLGSSMRCALWACIA